MIFRKYGHTYHSVTPNFDSRAMTEVGFQKSGVESLPTAEFEEKYERADGRELVAVAEGDVQDQVEQEMLTSLQDQLLELERSAGDGAVVVIESEQGRDHPKTREKQTTKVVGSDNRLYFQWTIDPPLRVGIYRQRKS